MNNNNIEFYLSKGFDLKTASYFAAGRQKIDRVIPEENYSLRITFKNGEVRLYPMADVIRPGTVFSFLSDYNRFRQVYLDEDGCVAWDKDPSVDSRLYWDNKVDLSSDSCYLDSIPV